MTIVLYEVPQSPPCHAVKLTAEHLGIPLEIRNVDLWKGEQKKPEFLAINPLGTVPAIDDEGFYLGESRAIIAYLVNKYSPDSPLYPKEPKARAVVERMLYFDFGLFQSLRTYVHNISPEEEVQKLEKVKQCLGILEKILETTSYAAGNHLTAADYSILSNVVFLIEVLDFSFDEYPKISAWLQRMKMETSKYKELYKKHLREFKESRKARKLQMAATRS